MEKRQDFPIFGSQLVDKNSSTPYSDATQVSIQQKSNYIQQV